MNGGEGKPTVAMLCKVVRKAVSVMHLVLGYHSLYVVHAGYESWHPFSNFPSVAEAEAELLFLDLTCVWQ